MRNPKISIIMAAYNSEKFIAEAIESIINQTFKEWELIIINDDSKDSTPRIIEDYQKKDDRIKITNLKKNSGPAAARNAGLRIARGKYIAILDSDDVALPKRLEIQYNYLEKNKDIFLVGSSFKYIDENGKELMKEKYQEKIDAEPNKLYWLYWPHHSSVMFRATPVMRYRNMLRQNEDNDLFQRVIEKRKKLQILPDLLSGYRIHQGSLSVRMKKEQDYFNAKVSILKKQRLKNGKDDYKKMRPFIANEEPLARQQDILKERKEDYLAKRKADTLCFKKIIASRTYKNGEMKKFRNLLFNSILSDGLKNWLKETPYYFISFIPKKTKDNLKRFIKNKIAIQTINNIKKIRKNLLNSAESIKKAKIKLSNLLKYGCEDIFSQIDIETITACNRRCPYCPNSIYERGLLKNKKLLNKTIFCKIINELAQINYEGIINPDFYGEPLLDKRIVQFIKYAKNKLPKSKIVLYTNGDFLTISLYKKLVLAGVDKFIIAQHSKKKNKEIEKILKYNKIRPEDNVKVTYTKLQFINNRGGLIKFGMPIKKEKCRVLDPQIVIDCKGNAILCCQDYLSSVKFGSIKNERLLDIWKKSEYVKIRRDIRGGNFSLNICKKCTGKIK